MGRVLYAGIDVGASATKAALLAPDGLIAGKAAVSSGFDFSKASAAAFDAALLDAGASTADVAYAISTGYGRKNVISANAIRTEIACHAKGAFHYFPKEITVVDIGGQDNKIIKVSGEGKRLDFKMNRKCAAGTGVFLEEIAYKMDIPLNELNGLGKQSDNPVELGSYCTVFTGTEILSRIREGRKKEDIVRGVFGSVVKRIIEMDPLEDRVAITGGVIAHNDIILDLLRICTKKEILIPRLAQFTGALGAALSAMESE